MLNIQIDNPELEKSIEQTYGEDVEGMASAFSDFIQEQKIKQDIGVSIQQLEAGEGIALSDVMKDVRSKYE